MEADGGALAWSQCRNAFKGKISYSENGGTELLLEMSQRKCKAVFRISPSIPAAAVGKYRRGSQEWV